MERLTERTIVTGHQVPVLCKHCGKWHYGKSRVGRDVAERDAARQIEQCRRTYQTMGWPDELTDADISRDTAAIS